MKNEKKLSPAEKAPKFREQKDNVSLKPLTGIFFFACLAGIVLRTLQMAKYIEPETGFTTGGMVFQYALYALLAASAIAFFVTAYLSSQSAKLNLYCNKNKTVGAVTAVMGVFFIYDSLDSFFGAMSASMSSYSSEFTTLMKSGTMPLLIQSFFGFFAGIFFFILAKDLIKGTGSASKRRIMATAPVWWAGSRLILRFVRQISFVEISDLFLELIMLAFMVMFFMALSQLVSGVYSSAIRWRIYGLGLPAALIALTLNVPRLILSFVQGGAFINPEHPFCVADLIFGVFVLVLVIFSKPYEAASEEEAE